ASSMRISAATVTSPSRASGSDRPPWTQRSASRDQPTLGTTTTPMLDALNPTRCASDIAPTAPSTTNGSWTQIGFTRGPTQIYMSAGESLAAHLAAPG
ncbi:MAG: hypothetical protein ACLP8S_10420, partial [Solirubrobacteraceae bacterium]